MERSNLVVVQLPLAALIGCIAFVLQLFAPGIPLWGIGKIEFADVAAVVGAALTGPLGSVVVAVLFGLGSPSWFALTPLALIDLPLIGYFANTKRMGWKVIPFIHLGVTCTVGASIFKLLVLPEVPFVVQMGIAFAYNLPGAVLGTMIFGTIQKVLPALKKGRIARLTG